MSSSVSQQHHHHHHDSTAALSAKKRSSSPLTKRKTTSISPFHDSLRRTPPELVAAELQRKSTSQLIAAERDMQNLLELEYKDDVRAYMSEMESKTTASVDLIDQQPELQWYMRPYLVDFLIEIHQQHRLRPETLYLALNIVDRYVSKRIVFKKHYQLVGCAALWIAAKFEDAKDRVPTVPELCQMCCGAYDESAFIQMEGHVLSTIGWVIGHPTTEAWLRLACVTGQIEEQRTQHVARFIMEITLFHKEYIPYKPSELALASLLLARFLLGKTRRIADESEAVIHVAQMLDLHLAEHLDKVSAIVVKKYSFPFYSRASTFVREWYLSGRRFSYFDWTSSPSPRSIASTPLSTPSSMFSKQHHSSRSSMNSSPMAPSSCDLVSSSPARSMSSEESDSCEEEEVEEDDDDDDDEEEEDEEEPLTPNTPLPPYPSLTADILSTLAIPVTVGGSTSLVAASAEVMLDGKENLPRSTSKSSLNGSSSSSSGGTSCRPPLNRASWDLNETSAGMSGVMPTYST